MTDDQFPLCKKAGLEIDDQSPYWIPAADVEKLLAQAHVVTGLKHADYGWTFDQHKQNCDTHQARLLLIEPIQKPDTAEGLLREFTEYFNSPGDYSRLQALAKRASRLLEGK